MRDSLYNPFMSTKPQIVYGGGGGGGAPAPVQPTVNTDTVQQANVGANHVGGTSGGKSGGNPFEAAPVQQPNQIQFGGYGQQSPFGMTNPSQWGTTNLGGVQNTTTTWTPGTNTFDPNAFAQSQQSLQMPANPTLSQGQLQENNDTLANNPAAENYNQTFTDTFNHNVADAEANPYGTTTGTPVNVTDNNINDWMAPTVNTSNDDNSWMNDGDATNDQGNAGWGFTSIEDMFDGGGPGQSGDSYSGGIHGNNTVGSTAQGVTSIVTNPSGSNNNDDDGGGGSSGGK